MLLKITSNLYPTERTEPNKYQDLLFRTLNAYTPASSDDADLVHGNVSHAMYATTNDNGLKKPRKLLW